MDATTKERVKDLLDITSTSHDTVLDRLVAVVSQRIENFIDRPLLSTARTEEYSIKPRQGMIFLRAYPLADQSSVGSLKVATDWDFAAATAVDADSYHADLDTGQIHMRYYPIENYLGRNATIAPSVVQVTYTGGFATDTADLISNYPAIAYACEEQVVAMWRRRDDPAAGSVSIDQYSRKVEAPLKFLPDVVEALTPYRRLRFGQ